jgi:hypothetical protein
MHSLMMRVILNQRVIASKHLSLRNYVNDAMHTGVFRIASSAHSFFIRVPEQEGM